MPRRPPLAARGSWKSAPTTASKPGARHVQERPAVRACPRRSRARRRLERGQGARSGRRGMPQGSARGRCPSPPARSRARSASRAGPGATSLAVPSPPTESTSSAPARAASRRERRARRPGRVVTHTVEVRPGRPAALDRGEGPLGRDARPAGSGWPGPSRRPPRRPASVSSTMCVGAEAVQEALAAGRPHALGPGLVGEQRQERVGQGRAGRGRAPGARSRRPPPPRGCRPRPSPPPAGRRPSRRAGSCPGPPCATRGRRR